MRKLLKPSMLVLSIGILITAACMSNTSDESEVLSALDESVPTTSDVMFTGKENHDISLEDAEKMILEYAEKYKEGPFAWTFGRDAVEEILAQEGCVALRIFGGLYEGDEFHPILIGVTSDGRSMSGGAVRDFPLPCPPYCPEP